MPAAPFAVRHCLLRRARWRWPFLMMALAWVVACGDAAPNASTWVHRLIETDPARTFNPDVVFGAQEASRWSFTDAEEVARWTTEGIASIDVNERRGSLLAEGDPTQRPVLRLTREVELTAQNVHAIEVQRVGRWHEVNMQWAGPGEAFSSARQVRSVRDRDRKNTFVFPVSKHPRWQGPIARLRLQVVPRRDEPVRLSFIAAVHREAGAESLAEVLLQPWKVELGADMRNALLGAPGVPIVREVAVGERARLRFAYGVPKGTEVPITFRVRAGDPGSADDSWTTLFERTIKPDRLYDQGQWHTADADLGRWADQTVVLRFEMHADSVLDPGRGLPAWAHPEIVGQAPTLASSNESTADESAPTRPNVVFISLDTLRADRLSSYGYEKKTTPHMDRWARESAVRFANTVAQAPWTLPSHVSMFTGLDPQRHGANHSAPMSPQLDLLPEMLRREGYATAAFTGGGYLHPHFGFPQGFDVFRYWPDRIGKHELRDGMARTIDWLETVGDRQFFLFFHTYEPHFPHRRRMPYMGLLDGLEAFRLADVGFEMRDHGFKGLQWGGNYMVVERPGDATPHPGLTPEEWALISDMYDSAVAYTDAQVGRLLAALRRLGHARDTIVVITSDHGEALGEDGLVGHNYLEEHNLMVPLFIGFPDGRGRGRSIQDQVRSIDLVPTILSYLGISPSSGLDGVSLLPLVDGDTAGHPDEAWSYASSANFGLSVRIKNRLKYRYNNSAWADLYGNEALYDLRSDPGESTNLAPEHSMRGELRNEAKSRLNILHSGLRVEVRNHTKGLLRGRLKGDGLQHARIKLGIPSCRCLFWKPGAVFRVPTAKGMSLQIEGPALAGLQVVGTLKFADGREFPFDHTFDLDNIMRTESLGFNGKVWKPNLSTSRSQVRFTIRRPLLSALPPAAPEARDRELEQQLKALGYVN